MRRLFLDTSVLALALGAPHPSRQAAQDLLTAGSSKNVELHVSAEAIQELLFHRMRRGEREVAVIQSRAVRQGCVVHPVDEEVLDRMLELVATTRLRGRDAVHAATALHHGFSEIVSADTDFDGVPGLTRIDPASL